MLKYLNTMKSFYHIKATLLMIMTITACSELEITPESQNDIVQELRITGKDFIVENETRSTVSINENGASFLWDENDVIGIFPDKGDQVSFAMDKGAGTQTATFSGGGWALKSSAKYTAYYPHVYENRDMTAIPVSYVGQTQNGNGNTDHIGAYDFMAAGISTPENGTIAFDMQHLGVLVQLTITIPEPSNLSKVVLNSTSKFALSGTINLTAESPAITAKTQSNLLEIALNDVVTTSVNENIVVYFMTAPVNLTDSEIIVTVYSAEEVITKVGFKGDKQLQAGKAYRFVGPHPDDYVDEYSINHGKGIEIDGVIWAPVNCGYHATDFKYGKFYQWGRKYGQGTSPNVVYSLTYLSEGQLPTNEEKFYCMRSTDYDDWLNGSDASIALWNSGTEEMPIKTEYDPCPDGWRVPSYAELKNLCQNKSEKMVNNEGQAGYWLSGSVAYAENTPKVFFPAAGYIGANDGIYSSMNSVGAYWSSNAYYDYSYSYKSTRIFFNLDYDIFYIGNRNKRAFGSSVRCVKE